MGRFVVRIAIYALGEIKINLAEQWISCYSWQISITFILASQYMWPAIPTLQVQGEYIFTADMQYHVRDRPTIMVHIPQVHHLSIESSSFPIFRMLVIGNTVAKWSFKISFQRCIRGGEDKTQRSWTNMVPFLLWMNLENSTTKASSEVLANQL